MLDMALCDGGGKGGREGEGGEMREETQAEGGALMVGEGQVINVPAPCVCTC